MTRNPTDSAALAELIDSTPSVHVDLCWAWIVGPLATMDFVQRS